MNIKLYKKTPSHLNFNIKYENTKLVVRIKEDLCENMISYKMSLHFRDIDFFQQSNPWAFMFGGGFDFDSEDNIR